MYVSLFFCLVGTVYAFQTNSNSLFSQMSKTYMSQPKDSENNSPTDLGIAYTQIPPRYNKKPPRKIQWLPFGNINAPPALDGTFAGDVGFDPCGFVKSINALYWMREAEIKHARLAMLAAVGWPLSELWHKPMAEFLQLDSILADGDRAPSILNGGLSSTYASGMLIFSMLVAGYLENKALNSGEIYWNAEKPANYTPGDYDFDPYGLYNIRGDKKQMETAEIKHGRIAMIAIVAYIAQEFATGLPVVEQTPYLF